ncbi:MAG TPA: hypothetical protein VK897_01610 [Anaerolineales bacterium]|nr:hypothetical protein [Anaerolineales bacterium]
MAEKFLVMLEAFTIRLLIAIAAFALVPLAFGVYFLPVIAIFLQTVPLLTISGALIGKLFTKNHMGTLFGAGLGAILGYLWLFSITSKMLFD